MLKEAELEEAAKILVTECYGSFNTINDAKNALVEWVDKIDQENLSEYGERGYLVRRIVPLNPFDQVEYAFCRGTVDEGDVTIERTRYGIGTPLGMVHPDAVDDGIN